MEDSGTTTDEIWNTVRLWVHILKLIFSNSEFTNYIFAIHLKYCIVSFNSKVVIISLEFISIHFTIDCKY